MKHYNNNKHLDIIYNILDCLYQISTHFVTFINVYVLKKYMSLYPDKKGDIWIRISYFISFIECLSFQHTFPIGTFYLVMCLFMVFFVTFNDRQMKSNLNKMKQMTNKLD